MSMNGDLYSLWWKRSLFESLSEDYKVNFQFKNHRLPEHYPQIVYAVAGPQDE